jgi:Cu/Ag efflux protein CusF
LAKIFLRFELSKAIGKISLRQLLIGLALVAGVALAGLFLLPIENVHSGEIRKLDRETRRIVIQERDLRRGAGSGLVLSSRLDTSLNIDALCEGDHVRFTMTLQDNEWKVTHIEAQP